MTAAHDTLERLKTSMVAGPLGVETSPPAGRMPPGPTEVAGTSGQFWPTTGPEHRFAPSHMGGYVTQTPATVDNLRWRSLSSRDRHKNATRSIGPTALRDHGKMLDMIEGQGVGRLQAGGPAPPNACTAKCFKAERFECQSF